MNLDDFLGKHYLTGVEYGTIDKTEEYPYEMCNTVDFILDGKNISVVEDPSDGWRSSMDEILINRKGFKVNNTFESVEIVEKYRGQKK